jgi:hypothetical protein
VPVDAFDLAQSSINTLVGILAVEVVIPKERGIVAREGRINPRMLNTMLANLCLITAQTGKSSYLIRYTPNRNTNTLGDINAGLGDGVVVGLLLVQLGSGDRSLDSDV